MVTTSKQYKKNDFILRTDTAIIITSHCGHRLFLKATLTNFMKTGDYVILSYDSHKQWPHTEILNIPHTWVTKPRTYGAEKRIGWLYDVLLAGGILRPLMNVQAVIITNGDIIFEKPENVDALRKYVDRYNGDMMCVTAEPNLLHTAAMIMKGWAFQSFVDYIATMLTHNIPESYSPEVLLRDWVETHDIKNVVPEVQPLYPKGHRYAGKIDHYASYNQDHTWKRLVGFRNLGGEMKAICHEHLEPLPSKYFYMGHPPNYFNHHEASTLYKYYQSGDRRWLYKYFSEGEESSFNRRYYPIEYYGGQPLYDDKYRKRLGPPTERDGVFDRFKTGSYVLKDEEFHKKHKEWIQKHYPELLKGEECPKK